MDKAKYILFDKRQTLAESVVSDGVTFGLLALCIWISIGSKWWTFFTALGFLFFLGAKCSAAVAKRQIKFTDLDAMQTWIDRERSND